MVDLSTPVVEQLGQAERQNLRLVDYEHGGDDGLRPVGALQHVEHGLPLAITEAIVGQGDGGHRVEGQREECNREGSDASEHENVPFVQVAPPERLRR